MEGALMGGRGSGGHNRKRTPEPLAKGDPWARQPEETDKAWEAFRCYRDMGLSRTLKKTADRLSKTTATLSLWHVRWSWTERAAAWDAAQDNVVTAAALESLGDMARRHMKVSRRAQDFLGSQLEKHIKQAETLKDVPHAELRTIMRSIERLGKFDRLVRDQATEKVDTGSELDLSQLSIAELKQLRALQAKATKGDA